MARPGLRGLHKRIQVIWGIRRRYDPNIGRRGGTQRGRKERKKKDGYGSGPEVDGDYVIY